MKAAALLHSSLSLAVEEIKTMPSFNFLQCRTFLSLTQLIKFQGWKKKERFSGFKFWNSVSFQNPSQPRMKIEWLRPPIIEKIKLKAVKLNEIRIIEWSLMNYYNSNEM